MHHNYFNIEKSGKVIAKIKWCSFFGSQCTLRYITRTSVVLANIIHIANKTFLKIIVQLPNTTLVIQSTRQLANHFESYLPGESKSSPLKSLAISLRLGPKYISMKFFQFVANLYPRKFTNFA